MRFFPWREITPERDPPLSEERKLKRKEYPHPWGTLTDGRDPSNWSWLQRIGVEGQECQGEDLAFH